ncbi:hypothetical protein GCM10017673_14480 [Streptosporangium violaceochromogenes]|nr:hypothetical protein GCM10017673_14480 [Streptosporangium violaceochromogenes]
MTRLPLLPFTATAWAGNVIYVVADLLLSPALPGSVQALLLAAALALTAAHLINAHSVEFRAGYLRGRIDADRDRA